MRREQGQALTEFALILPLLVVLLFGIIQFGIAFNNYVTLTDAVRAGARQGAVGRHIGGPAAAGAVEDRVREAASGLNQDELAVTVSSPFTQGSDVTVTATYPYTISLFGLPVWDGDLTSTTTERVE
ncbi:MAG: TadE/TadG family type IV pilus assembly protein [bacterium]